MTDKKLNLVVDTYGCPNRCLHCWLGHMKNKRMDDNADKFIVDYFSPYFDKIAYYSWLREPDYCDNYKERWERDNQISKNTAPQRFELASFYRIVRDGDYIPFLKSVGTKKVQLTFFGLKETQDRYVGRSGAYEEVMRATGLLIKGGIIPRWQCFINEENKEEIIKVYEIAKDLKRTKCPDLEFFVHEGTCDGENEKLYPIRIEKKNIPKELLPVYLDFDELMTERECCEILSTDDSSPVFDTGDEITLNISNEYDVYYNITHMTKPWRIGNLKTDGPGELVRRVMTGDTYALNKAKECKWQELVKAGDFKSEKAFRLDDYKIYLFNKYLDKTYKESI
jgi:hypothetical protein